MTHPLLTTANEKLTEFEAMLADARDVLFNLAEDITNNVPAQGGKAQTIERILNLRRRL